MSDKNTAVRLELFDPPMCCPGGLCGPAIDPALLDVNEAVLRLKNEHGIAVNRYLLQQQGQKFMENPEVLGLLREHGTDILPVTTLNGKIVKTRAFPSYEELVSYTEQAWPASYARCPRRNQTARDQAEGRILHQHTGKEE